MTACKKIKKFGNIIVQIKAQCNLDKQTTNISALSSEIVSLYEFLLGQDTLLEKDFYIHH